jgi:hypothetical protein
MKSKSELYRLGISLRLGDRDAAVRMVQRARGLASASKRAQDGFAGLAKARECWRRIQENRERRAERERRLRPYLDSTRETL